MGETRRYEGTSPTEAIAKFEADRDPMAFNGYQPGEQTQLKEARRLRPDLYVLTVEWVAEEPWSGVRFYPGHGVRLRVDSAAEARAAIKEVRMRKKELAVQKRDLAAQASNIRAANRGNTSTGKVADALGRIASAKAAIDSETVELDRAILQLEKFVAVESATQAAE